MSINPLLLPVKKDADTIRATVLTTIVKMLYRRGWISENNVKKQIDNIVSSQNDDNVYKVTLDVKLLSLSTYDPQDDNVQKKIDKEFDDKTVMIKLLPQKVTSISKSPIITEFLTTYKKTHRILVVDEISEKAKHQLVSNKHIEVFNEVFLMMDIMEFVSSPKYEVLTPEQCIELLETYHLTRRQMKLMLDSDPVSNYLFLKKKQIVRIIRDSELTGKAIDYRIVVHKGT
jgi:DNA-directed RNA polymerase subunit H (RpoH/RPB5)